MDGADESGERHRSTVEQREREGVGAGAGPEHGRKGGDGLRREAGIEATSDDGIPSGGGRGGQGEWWLKCSTKCSSLVAEDGSATLWKKSNFLKKSTSPSHLGL